MRSLKFHSTDKQQLKIAQRAAPGARHDNEQSWVNGEKE